jgi:hypothetical protein
MADRRARRLRKSGRVTAREVEAVRRKIAAGEPLWRIAGTVALTLFEVERIAEEARRA